jgi:manganese transport protein
MEGFLHFRMRPWLRRAVTRFLAITPAALTVYFAGDAASYKLIINSQIILSLQLPFAVIPLIHFTSDRKRMGEFASPAWLQVMAWLCAAFILSLNGWLAWDQMSGWVSSAGVWRPFVLIPAVVLVGGLAVLLVTISFWPWIQRGKADAVETLDAAGTTPFVMAPAYSSILVPLDHTGSDSEAVGSALALARLHGGQVTLLHIEEGVTSQLFGSQSSTAEITEGQDYLSGVADLLRREHIEVNVLVRHGKSPAKEIAAAAAEVQPDLVIMASHGHSGIKDLIFGTTINAVRHRLKVPLLIVSKS